MERVRTSTQQKKISLYQKICLVSFVFRFDYSKVVLKDLFWNVWTNSECLTCEWKKLWKMTAGFVLFICKFVFVYGIFFLITIY